MKWSFLIASLCLLGNAAAQISAAGASHARDEEAIRRVVTNWDQGWKDFDAQLATRDYSDDADWTNAFGGTRKGRVTIERFLGGMFKTPEMRSRKSTPSTVALRFVKPDVVIVWSSRDTVGQRTATGAEYPIRKTHDLRVLTKENDRWLIVSHLIMDEKDVRP